MSELVQLRQDPHGTGAEFRAVCVCGWKGPSRHATDERLDADRQMHLCGLTLIPDYPEPNEERGT